MERPGSQGYTSCFTQRFFAYSPNLTKGESIRREDASISSSKYIISKMTSKMATIKAVSQGEEKGWTRNLAKKTVKTITGSLLIRQHLQLNWDIIFIIKF